MYESNVLADAFTFEVLPPSGEVSGPAGAMGGWGETVANPSATEWLLLAGIRADSFVHYIPDPSIFDFPILARSSLVSAVYGIEPRSIPTIPRDCTLARRSLGEGGKLACYLMRAPVNLA